MRMTAVKGNVKEDTQKVLHGVIAPISMTPCREPELAYSRKVVRHSDRNLGGLPCTVKRIYWQKPTLFWLSSYLSTTPPVPQLAQVSCSCYCKGRRTKEVLRISGRIGTYTVRWYFYMNKFIIYIYIIISNSNQTIDHCVALNSLIFYLYVQCVSFLNYLLLCPLNSSLQLS